MIRSSIVSSTLFALVMATPALAHLDQMPHSHGAEINGPLAVLALAGVLGLLFLQRRLVAVRS